jgi:hypothetical protein
MENIVKIIVWFFIVTGAIVVTKICLFNTDPQDMSSVFLSLLLINIVWVTVGIELENVVKNFKK